MEDKQYIEYVHANAQKSAHVMTLVWAFLVGGVICCIGQGFGDIFALVLPDWEKSKIAALVSMTMIFLGSFLTGVGVYDKLGAKAGGGSIVPITGFANSVASTAIEYQKEGQVYGIGCKIFTIAGPVILYGIFTSWVLGVIYWIGKMFGIA